MPSLTPAERLQRAQAALKKARTQDKLTVKELGDLIAATGEINAIALRVAQALLNNNRCTDSTRIRAAELIVEGGKVINRAVENAIKMGIQGEEPKPEPKPEVVAPDFSTPETEDSHLTTG